MIPFNVWWADKLADAHIRHLHRNSPARPPSIWFYGGVWKLAKRRPSTVPMRQLGAMLKAIDFKPGVGRKQNLNLLFSLAQWGAEHDKLPKKALTKFTNDHRLFEVLQRCGEIHSSNAMSIGELPPGELLKLEKRLHHQWSAVQQIVDALVSHKKPLIAANASRRKVKRYRQKPVKSVTSIMLGV